MISYLNVLRLMTQNKRKRRQQSENPNQIKRRKIQNNHKLIFKINIESQMKSIYDYFYVVVSSQISNSENDGKMINYYLL